MFIYYWAAGMLILLTCAIAFVHGHKQKKIQPQFKTPQQKGSFKLNDLANEIYQNNKAKGFWPEDKPRNVGELLMLVTSELGEAMEAHRKGRFADTEELKQALADGHTWENNPELLKRLFELTIKDSYSDEWADALIRLFDGAGGQDMDIDFHVRQKLEYNKTREKLHGKKY